MDGELEGGVKNGSALRPGSGSLNFFLCCVLGVNPVCWAHQRQAQGLVEEGRRALRFAGLSQVLCRGACLHRAGTEQEASSSLLCIWQIARVHTT